MDNQSFGGGGPQIDMSAVQAALDRRSQGGGQPVPQLSQVSGAAPTAQGAQPPQAPTGSGVPPSMSGGSSMPKAPDTESMLILKTMAGRLSTIGKLGQ